MYKQQLFRLHFKVSVAKCNVQYYKISSTLLLLHTFQVATILFASSLCLGEHRTKDSESSNRTILPQFFSING